jgi:hypothetical protein
MNVNVINYSIVHGHSYTLYPSPNCRTRNSYAADYFQAFLAITRKVNWKDWNTMMSHVTTCIHFQSSFWATWTFQWYKYPHCIWCTLEHGYKESVMNSRVFASPTRKHKTKMYVTNINHFDKYVQHQRLHEFYEKGNTLQHKISG